MKNDFPKPITINNFPKSITIPDSASDLSWECLLAFLLAQDVEWLGESGKRRLVNICEEIMEGEPK